jgi:lipopolysaccharide export system permease protein
MRIPRIIAGYIVREIIQYSVLGFLVFASLMLTQNLLRTLADLTEAAGSGASVWDLLRVLGYLLPTLATYALPVAFLFGVLLAVSRLASESEVLAMRACGLGMKALVGPVLVLSILVSGLTAYLMQEVEPHVRRQLRRVVTEAATRSLTIEPGHFRSFDKRLIYAQVRNADGTLQGIVIWDNTDSRRPFAVFSEAGSLRYDAETAEIKLILERGDMHIEPDDLARYRRISFETFDYTFDASGVVESKTSRMRPRDMSMGQLRSALALLNSTDDFEKIKHLPERRPVKYETQLHRRFAVPVAPIVFALLAVPMGLRRVRGARSAGALTCVAVAFTYYVLLSLAEFLAEDTAIPPVIALWLPNVIFVAAAIPLLRRASRGEG